jgi:hypothetical protein
VAPDPSPNKQRSFLPLLIVLALAAAAAGAAYWFFLRPVPQTGPQSLLTAEAKAYVRSLGLADVEMKATTNFMGHTVVEIVGKIANKGDRAIRTVELNCIFYDPYGQVVLRERVPIVRSRGIAFAPGQTREFRMPFDTLPSSWNQAMPQLVIARIEFEN